ncbi:MAG: GNAT family N-acetyltransferase [Clostridiales bacterium]|jgi:ribosomal protein S18 acetylase RimI-like enzyme|nr:GNAT family N-acetyltransferase [Clostridiales bacterium]
MEFRKAVETDLNAVMNIISQAQNYLKEQGIDQWQNGYPNRQTIINDIENGHSYVLLKDDIIVGTVAIIPGVEKTYESIYNGEWKSTGEYVTIHRIAIDSRYKRLGFATMILDKAEELCNSLGISSIRIDTHEENLLMQNLLQKNNYEYCGIIYLEDKSKRLAFEKVL